MPFATSVQWGWWFLLPLHRWSTHSESFLYVHENEWVGFWNQFRLPNAYPTPSFHTGIPALISSSTHNSLSLKPLAFLSWYERWPFWLPIGISLPGHICTVLLFPLPLESVLGHVHRILTDVCVVGAGSQGQVKIGSQFIFPPSTLKLPTSVGRRYLWKRVKRQRFSYAD